MLLELSICKFLKHTFHKVSAQQILVIFSVPCSGLREMMYLQPQCESAFGNCKLLNKYKSFLQLLSLCWKHSM